MTAVLRVEALRKTFGGLVVADGVSLALRPGDRTALIGPNGAGKTTLVNLITGHLRPAGGRVLLAGRDVTRLGPAGRVRRGLVRSFQVTRLFADMTPREHVALALLQRDGRSGSMAGSHLAMPRIVAETAAILEAMGLEGVADTPVAGIAYGLQRLIEIALVLALRPTVLLLDEPAAGVPQADMHRIEEALRLLPPDLAVLLVEHDMEFVFRFARRVVVLAAGSVIFEGPAAAAAADPGVRLAYLGRDADAGRGA